MVKELHCERFGWCNQSKIKECIIPQNTTREENENEKKKIFGYSRDIN